MKKNPSTKITSKSNSETNTNTKETLFIVKVHYIYSCHFFAGVFWGCLNEEERGGVSGVCIQGLRGA